MKKLIVISLSLVLSFVVQAANVPAGVTGLWRFQDTNNLGLATIGNNIMLSNAPYGGRLLGPWTDIGTESWHTMFSDGYVFQETSWDYMAVNPNFEVNGGGAYVNEYTVAIDYVQTSGHTSSNSLFQTAFNGNGNDGDLWVLADGTIGVDDVGFSTLTFDKSQWHRIVWSVDNGNFFRVYVDGTLLLDAPGQTVDGRFSLYPDRFNLFADNNWYDQWGLVGTVITWGRALSTEEISGMGGWTNGATTPTPLIFSETTTNPTPVITSISPANGETNVAPGFSYLAKIVDSSTATVDTNSIQLQLDGLPVSPQITSSGGLITVNFSAGGLLRSGSTHTYSLVFETTGVASTVTTNVTFKVQNYTGYEWRFTNGDLSPALGNGSMIYADESTTPGLTSFGTTDGSTVPHINGTPAKYLYEPGFTFDTDGYLLILNNSGPNVGTNAYINRYSLFFDILVPGPWPAWVVPFFNTEPYNLDDADFYLQGNGSIGIGGGGYSSAGVMTPNVWYRVGFIADMKADTLEFYVNGTKVKTRSAGGLGSRWSLYSNQDVGPLPKYPGNVFLLNEGDSSGIYTHELYLSSVAFIDRYLNSSEVAALGGPHAGGILVRSLSPNPQLTIERSGGSVTVSWPPSYVGYCLEQSESLAAPQWKPVAGTTNNVTTINPAQAARFYRLIQ